MSDEGPVIYGGRYELHRRLARGGMADVYLARDQLLNRPVAVKVLFAQYASDPAFVERFRREAQAAANLTHPNIVAVYDWGEEADTYFIVMEYVNGRSLADVLRQEGTLLPERAADIGIDIAAALGFAHRNGVVHRDVKPGNVMLASDGQVKVTDFGIARAISAQDENLTQAGLVMGTATYFSPEQAQGRNVDPRSDVYSLGVVLYEIVCGRPPFRGDDALAVAYQHVQEMPTPPREINASIEPTLEAIILKCLAKEPSARYPSSEDLRSDLRRYREGAEIAARPVEPMPAPVPAPDATQAIPATSATRAQVAYSGGGYPDDYDPTYDDYYEEPPKKNGVFIGILVVLLLLLCGVLYLLANALGVIGGDDEGELISVPDVINQPYEDARDELIDLGFEVAPEFEDNPDVEDGLVFEQDPGAGAEAEEGDKITLKVSEGEELVAVPPVTGLTEEEARDRLTEAGFTNVEPRQVSNPDEEVGTVVTQTPEANAEAPLSTNIVIEVSSGPEERTIPTDLASRPAAEAEAILRNQDLEVVQQEEVSDSVPAGNVIGTEPPGGTTINEGDSVTLIVSAGREQVTVPDVTEKTEATAKSELSLAGFQVTVVDKALPFGDPDDGRVLSQDPPGGERHDKGSVIRIEVGRAATEDTTTTTTTEPGDGG